MYPLGARPLLGCPRRTASPLLALRGGRGAMVLNNFPSIMAPQNNKRRLVEDDDSESDSEKRENWAKYIILSTLDENEKPITKLSPFVIEKSLKGIVGEVQSVKKMKNENLLVECKNRKQSLVLQSVLKFGGIKVIGTPSFRLNRSKGVIRDKGRGLYDMGEAEITNELKEQGILLTKRVKIKKNGNFIPTNTYILDFDTPTPPGKIKIGYYYLNVETFVPNPLRCFNCQRFGHSSDRCKNEKVCFRCGSENCSEEVCKEEPKCVNCNNNHPSSSKQCSVWLKEKEIQKLKVEKRLSYPDARKLYNTQHPSISYAAVLKHKTTREIACQTDPVTPPSKQNKSNLTTPKNVDTPSESPKQVISASPKPNVPQKPKDSSAPKNVKKPSEQKLKQIEKPEKDSESSKKLPKPIIKSDRTPKAMRDPISVYNRYNILEEERMDTSSSHSRSHSLSPSKTRTKIKLNQV